MCSDQRSTHLLFLAGFLATASLVDFAVFVPVVAQPFLASEPNDTLDTATTIPLQGSGSYRTGGFIGDGPWGERDVDWYRLDLPEILPTPLRLTARVEASFDDLDPAIRLLDESGYELQRNDDLDAERVDAEVETTFLSTGRYYLGVSSARNIHYDAHTGGSGRPETTGAYALVTTMTEEAPPDSRFEPNDTLATATPMGGAGFQVLGEFIGDGDNDRRDVDIYKMDTFDPSLVRIELHTASSTLRPVVRVTGDQAGVRQKTFVESHLAAMLEDWRGRDGTLRQTVWVPGHRGAWRDTYIVISGVGNRRYDTAAAGSGEPGSVGYYDLAVLVMPIAADGTNEPNDSTTMATQVPRLSPGDRVTLAGEVGDGPYGPSTGDRDVYQISVTEGVALVARVTPGEGSDLVPVATAYDHYSHQIVRGQGRVDHRDAQVIVPWVCTRDWGEPFSFYLMVSAAGGRPPNDPHVPLLRGSAHIGRLEEHEVTEEPRSRGGYELTIEAVGTSCVNEPDDSLQLATDTGLVDHGFFVCSDGRLDDGVCPPGRDVDMWSFRVVRPPVEFAATVEYCADGPFAIARLFDEGGRDLGRAEFHGQYSRPFRFVVMLTEPGTYYLGNSMEGHDRYDPNNPCAGNSNGGYPPNYELLVELTPRPQYDRDLGPRVPGGRETEELLVATDISSATPAIHLLDPDTLQIRRTLPAPERVSGPASAVAYDGARLWYLDSGWYPRLSELDRETGEVLSHALLWVGSGLYTDATMLGGVLYVADARAGRIHALDPDRNQLIRSLPVTAMNDIFPTGGLAGLSGPNRLYVADAFGTGEVYDIRPDTGEQTGVLETETRPTALAGIGTRRLFAADFIHNSIEMFDRDGTNHRTLTVPFRVGALAGAPAVDLFGDFDGDGDVDLADAARFQACFTGDDGPFEPGCEPGDANGDERIDLSDLAAFDRARTGP
jgi:hypothetical protein